MMRSADRCARIAEAPGQASIRGVDRRRVAKKKVACRLATRVVLDVAQYSMQR
jgi:hypothetical protein